MITEPLMSRDHLEIRDVVHDFVEAQFTSERVRADAANPYDELAWKQMVELGWSGLGISSDNGGAALGSYVQCIVHRELGARLAPSPYLSSAAFSVAALNLLAAPDTAGPLLSGLANGMISGCVVLGHGQGWPTDNASIVATRQVDDGWELTGDTTLTLDAAGAEALFVVALIDGTTDWGLFQIDGRNEEICPGAVTTVDRTRTFGDLHFDATPAIPLHEVSFGADRVASLVDQMAVFLSAEMVGAAKACMEQTLEYLKTRHQFGKPIGSFQALKHRCADLAVGVTIAQELVFSAAETVDGNDAAALALVAPLALARCGEVLKKVTEEAIQLHGGVGFTDEIDIGLYYKRAISDLELIATPIEARARLNEVRHGCSE